MRISTAQMFNQNVSSLNRSQTQTSKLMDQLSSGKQVNTAGDDPVAAIGIDNLNQQNSLIQQFQKNIDYANKHLSLAESQLGDAESLSMSIRDRMLAAVNGTYTADERQGFADELRSSLAELQAIANSQDESGNYLFAGAKSDTQPFAFDNSGNMVYSGDSGVRTALVAAGIAMPTNIAGDAAFMKAPNAMGDFSVNYSAAQTGEFSVNSTTISDPASYVPGDYSFSFIDNGSGGLDVQVFDSASSLVTTINNFDPTNPISFNGIDVSVDGSPNAGDSFSIAPQDSVSIFDTVQQTIDLFENGDEINTPAGKAQLAQLLNNFDSGVDQIRIGRSQAGTSLSSLDSYSDNHADTKLVNSSALSVLQDLDYASAVTEYQKQQLATNAVSSLFSKVGSVSLFDYL
ncbi:flagellar hook-associated protein FlgL [Shewanella dokdonensis]|uniref:Flagellar hook-associated protein FlgL n=1 Tax=Shewanella dokdonensis TaxID=712036 RepID=A0ABX8DGG2_9GAMM|nr:flagellar hook-associated protein FlgL [Shewanella dokdonensis]MCL1073950.1 flagellar hook-associated protein FlgL [Shewanella dokdonensis]QVK23716.1 flagellar hook-associated protein FlgL [Shewanella dokdonensis]